MAFRCYPGLEDQRHEQTLRSFVPAGIGDTLVQNAESFPPLPEEGEVQGEQIAASGGSGPGGPLPEAPAGSPGHSASSPCIGRRPIECSCGPRGRMRWQGGRQWRGPTPGWPHAASPPGHPSQKSRSAGGPQGGANIQDLALEDFRLYECIGPVSLQQFRLGDESSGALDEMPQNGEGFRRQVNALIVPPERLIRDMQAKWRKLLHPKLSDLPLPQDILVGCSVPLAEPR